MLLCPMGKEIVKEPPTTLPSFPPGLTPIIKSPPTKISLMPTHMCQSKLVTNLFLVF